MARRKDQTKRTALKPPAPGPLPELEREGYGDAQPDPLDSMTEKADRGEKFTTYGEKPETGERDLHDEEWRPHDRQGPYGQRRRRN